MWTKRKSEKWIHEEESKGINVEIADVTIAGGRNGHPEDIKQKQ